MTRPLTRLTLAALTVAAAAVVAVQPPSAAAATGSLTGLSLESDYQVARAADGCSRKDPSNIYLKAPGRGRVFAATEYESGWVVTLDVSTPDGELLGTVETTDAYTSTYDDPSLEIYLRCKAVRQLLALGYGAGEELRLTVTSADFNDGEHSLETAAAVTSVTPKRVGSFVPQLARKTPRGYRITTQAQLWSAVDDGYGWADPGTELTVSGYWKNCPAATTTAATDGTFTVSWRKSALLNGTNFSYVVSETKRIGSFWAGWKIEGRRTFTPTERYYNGCGGA